MLVKLKGDGDKKYWIMHNLMGYTVPMDEDLKHVLES